VTTTDTGAAEQQQKREERERQRYNTAPRQVRVSERTGPVRQRNKIRNIQRFRDTRAGDEWMLERARQRRLTFHDAEEWERIKIRERRSE